MLTVDALTKANPQLWHHAGDDAANTAKHCEHVASVARDETARTLAGAWTSPAGDSARARFARHAESYEAAAMVMRAIARTYDGLAKAIETSQLTLHSALDYASRNQLKVNQDGSVSTDPVAQTPEAAAALRDVMKQAQSTIVSTLQAATAADAAAADELRTLAGLVNVQDPKAVRELLSGDGNGALAVALRLQGGAPGLHGINVSPAQIEAARRASAETGMSVDLILAIMWQEQQWYQNYEPNLDGPLTAAGRRANWASEETFKPDKSLGITHMKLATARGVIGENGTAFPGLSGLSDSQLAKYIEENPNEDVRLSAYYMKQLQKNPHGATTDKELFMLYAADTDQVRDSNARYGDDSSQRGAAIKARAENWDRLQQSLRDADAWNGLPENERRKALDTLAAQTPYDRKVDLNPLYTGAGVSSSTYGTGPLPPDRAQFPPTPTPESPVKPAPTVPAPRPGPAPAPPAQ
ncbi:class I SAM-dependent methyltransferase [Streptomyces sp. NRRL WC-3742]|uniref:class I SAM-dependent methyltransferase n=1 Tax=Streptomyces sp. NRRL WC-3742 TaxID=1463934 RepID=UPI0004CBA0B5|nr:class I SAM-dependent methyltransferase [Streptomyces sp. NRRL WC-3742]